MSDEKASGPTYKNGLFSCFGDCSLCLMNCFCPCITSTKIRAWMEEREWAWQDCCCACAVQNHVYGNRQLIRKKQGYEMDQCMDCLLSWLCGPCAAGQNHLEAREFGYEPEVVAANKDKAEEKGKLSGEEKNKE